AGDPFHPGVEKDGHGQRGQAAQQQDGKNGAVVDAGQGGGHAPAHQGAAHALDPVGERDGAAHRLQGGGQDVQGEHHAAEQVEDAGEGFGVTLPVAGGNDHDAGHGQGYAESFAGVLYL